MFVWDGEKAEGLGGTGDIVTYARQRGKPVVHIEPITKVVRRLDQNVLTHRGWCAAFRV